MVVRTDGVDDLDLGDDREGKVASYRPNQGPNICRIECDAIPGMGNGILVLRDDACQHCHSWTIR
jgi:hypothetical protein